MIRAKIVLYAADRLSNDIIAARLDTPRQVVSKWRKRFYHHRLPGLAGLMLLIVPFVERRSGRGEPSRWFTWLVIGMIVYMIVLTVLGYTADPTQ